MGARHLLIVLTGVNTVVLAVFPHAGERELDQRDLDE